MARGGTFGLASNGRGRGGRGGRAGYRGSTYYRGGRGRGRGGRGASNGNAPGEGPAPKREDDGTQLAERFEQVQLSDEIDEKFGFARVQEGGQRDGWLINMHPTLVKDAEYPGGKAAVDFYFIQDDGGSFKCTMQYEPYFHIACKVSVWRIFLFFVDVLTGYGWDFRAARRRASRNGS